MSKAVIFFADGFEECEGLLCVDILRRAGCQVITASISRQRQVISSHNISLMTDMLAGNIDFTDVDMIILPGGMPGTSRLAASSVVTAQCRAFAADPGKWVAAICAAPSVLAEQGLLQGKQATCHPQFEWKLSSAQITRQGVTVDGNIITGQGLGAAIPFALELAARLAGTAAAENIREAICYRGHYHPCGDET